MGPGIGRHASAGHGSYSKREPWARTAGRERRALSERADGLVGLVGAVVGLRQAQAEPGLPLGVVRAERVPDGVGDAAHRREDGGEAAGALERAGDAPEDDRDVVDEEAVARLGDGDVERSHDKVDGLCDLVDETGAPPPRRPALDECGLDQ